MSSHDRLVSRRNVMAGAGIASFIAAGSSAAEKTAGKIWSNEYWAKKGEVSLNLFRKRVGAPRLARLPCPCCFWCTVLRSRRARASTLRRRARANTR